MPRFVVERITDALNAHRQSVRGSRIHVLGVAYKAGVNDIRESPALTVMRILADKGAVLSYTDPYVPSVREEGFDLDSVPADAPTLGACDCTVILTAHSEIDYAVVVQKAQLIVDTRNALRGCQEPHVIRL
jgi:UDP-N-acetyl-D-glucosamine dehydrogenase